MEGTNSDKPMAVLLGGTENGLSAMQVLHAAGVRCALATTADHDIASRSRLPVRVFNGPDCTMVLDQVLRFAETLPVPPVLLVAGDRFLVAADAARQEISQVARLQLASPEAIATVVDKRRFSVAPSLARAPIARGRSLPEGAGQEAIESILTLQLPVVLKLADTSKQSGADGIATFGEAKAARFDSHEALLSALERAATAGISLLAQEYIPGGDDDHYAYFSYLDADHRLRTGFGVRKHRLAPIHNGAATCASICDDPELAAAARQVLEPLRYAGPISVCFKRRPDTGAYICYEVNGRLPMAHSTGHLAGKSLVLANYSDLTGVTLRAPKACRRPGARWITLRRDIATARAYRRAGELPLHRWAYSLRHVREVAEWSASDPLPMLSTLKRVIWRR